MLPNAFIVGAARCGTTSVHHYLSQHPDVFVPASRKELGWFTDESGRVDSFEVYQQLFDPARARPCRLDVSTSYLYPPGTAEAIRATCGPDVRIVIFVRNPIEASQSLWQFEVVHGFETLDFLAGIAAEAKRKADPSSIGGWAPNSFYRERYRYLDQITRYIDVFGRDRVQVIIFEHFFGDLRRGWRELCGFLGIDPEVEPAALGARLNESGRSRNPFLRRFLAAPPEALRQAARRLPVGLKWRIVAALQRLNIAPEARPMLDPAQRAYVRSLFADDIAGMSRLLGLDLDRLWR